MHIPSKLAPALLASTLAHAACPPLGPVLPPPRSPSTNEATIATLTADLEAQFTSTLNTSGVSIGVKSIHEDGQLFNYHFTPLVLSDFGTRSVDEYTVYRVGSVSKMIPVLLALQVGVDLDTTVLEYLPELRNRTGRDAISRIPWENVTVGSLASHLSGIPTDMAFDLAIFPTGPWTDMGLPKVPQGTGPNCSGLPGTEPCTKADLIQHINKLSPVFLPQTSPSYSNLGYAILGLVVEAATGRRFEDVARETIWDVAGMESTSFYGPVEAFGEIGFVPVGESTWNITLGIFEAAGGMFSNTVDLLAFAEAILDNRLLSPAETRRWLKLETHTSSLGQSVGNGWEILRTDNITSDGRVVDVYTKSGDLGLYHALMGIIPDYDVAISVIVGGAEVTLNPHSRSLIFSTVVKALVPAIEAAGKAEVASSGYVGTYSDESTNSSIVLTLEDGPGLLIESFLVRGFDVLSNIGSYSLGAAESGLDSEDVYVEGRLYPTNISSLRNGTAETGWRAVFDTTPPEVKAALDEELFYKDGSCDTWLGLDRVSYNFLSLAEFVFVTGRDGVVEAIRNPAFDITLSRV